MTGAAKCRRTRRPLALRRRAQARRLLHHRARPLSHRERRGRCGAAPARRGAVVEPRRSPSAVPPRAPRAGDRRHRSASRRHFLFAGRRALVRGWIDGVPLHIAKPHGDAAYFRSAKDGAAHAASRRHQPTTISPRNRTGCTPMAAPISPTSSWRAAFPPAAADAVSHRALRGSAASPQAQAPLRARRAHAGRTPRAGAQKPDHAASGWRPARKSITRSPAA